MSRSETARPQLNAPSAASPGDATEPSRPLRVLMIAPTSFFADYGCHVRILEEARILQKLGHNVTIAAYHNGRDLPDVDIRRTLAIPWRRNYEVGSSRHKIAFDALLGLKTLSLLARKRYDVIHAHLHEGALIGLVLGRLARTPVVFDFQGSLTEEMIDHQFLRRDSAVYKPLRRLETWIDRTAPVVFTSSTHAAELLMGEFGCKPQQITALPDCVNTDVFRPAADFPPGELDALRASLGIPPDAKVIVYLGLLARYQGADLLLEAFRSILARHDNVYLLLMGFPGELYYAGLAEKLGIRHAVILTGRVPYEQAPQHLALGDVAAAPKLSLTESSGKLLNYMAAALPTVAFNTPVAREYLGADGLLAAPGDAADLAEKLEAALFPPADAAAAPAEMGRRLRQRAIGHFDWRQAGQVIVEAYARLTAKPGSRSSARSVALSRQTRR